MSATGLDFWAALEQLLVTSRLVIDRPRGTPHPRYPEFRYPLDYGYLAGTTAADGEGVDVWVGSLPVSILTGVICTVDGLKREVELKLLVGCTLEEAALALAVHNRGDQAGLLVLRPPVSG